MCGIAGILSNNPSLPTEQRLHAAVQCLQHRGPEAEGIWINKENTVALGHRRLSIIDLSAEAAQPLHYLNRYHIIHNGEVYNYLELKKELEQKGREFKTRSDTEVIVAAYAEWKNDCVRKFDGMFAFAIWDEEEKKFFAARDRLGEKPFYFFFDEEQLMFSSELKAFWKMGVPKQLNQAMLYNFLSIGYTNNPADPLETFYEGIHKLPAASTLSYSFEAPGPELEKYWQVDGAIDNGIKDHEAMERFDFLFSESVRRRLRSDVPIGTSLSGGLDSSSIVAFCDQQSSDHYTHKCFTAAFEGFEKDELHYAEAVANKFGLEHHVVRIKEDDIVDLMNEMMQFQDEPVASASPLAQYAVYRDAKQTGVTVLLDGQGADELMAGYHKYYKWYWQELYRNRSLSSSGEMRTARANGIKEPFGLKNRMAALFPEFAASLLQSRKSKQAFEHPDLNREFAFQHKRELYYSLPATHDLSGALYFNTFQTGLEELLRLADRNSMAHATELRLPFLNYELVEFLFSLPPHFKIHQGWTKWLLRKSVEKRLPPEIAWRKDKVGFEPPQKQWMENKSVQAAIMEAKKKLVDERILSPLVLKKRKPHDAHAAENREWKYWTAYFLF